MYHPSYRLGLIRSKKDNESYPNYKIIEEEKCHIDDGKKQAIINSGMIMLSRR